MSRRATAAALALALAVTLAGCNVGSGLASPWCSGGDSEAVVLMAQSVPDAALVPCIDSLPAGWEVMDLRVTSGGTTMQITNERAEMMSVLQMRFVEACDVAGAVEVPSDEEGTRRYEEVEDVARGFAGTRTYVFDGGCATYRFDLAEDGWSAMVNDASIALTFVPRADLAEAVSERTGGAVDRL